MPSARLSVSSASCFARTDRVHFPQTQSRRTFRRWGASSAWGGRRTRTSSSDASSSAWSAHRCASSASRRAPLAASTRRPASTTFLGDTSVTRCTARRAASTQTRTTRSWTYHWRLATTSHRSAQPCATSASPRRWVRGCREVGGRRGVCANAGLCESLADAKNMWTCPRCRVPVRAVKQMTIAKVRAQEPRLVEGHSDASSSVPGSGCPHCAPQTVQFSHALSPCFPWRRRRRQRLATPDDVDDADDERRGSEVPRARAVRRHAGLRSSPQPRRRGCNV